MKKIIYFFLILLLSFSCAKKEVVVEVPSDKERALEIYQEAVDAMENGQLFFASKKFSEAEIIMPSVEYAAKAALMSSYCLYIINFYDEANESMNRFINKYPADKNIPYAHYLLIISAYEQILDEKKDIVPLEKSKEKILWYIKNYPETEFAIDLEFKLDLVNNQLAAKEMYVAKYYIQTQKWIPAINRLKIIVNNFSDTIFIEEALHRLVEVYYKVGLENEAKAAAALLGYNYNSSEWYKQSYKILNRDYKIILSSKKSKKKNDGLIKRTIKKLTGK